MGFPRLGAFVGAIAVVLAALPPGQADGQSLDLTVPPADRAIPPAAELSLQPAGVAVAVIPVGHTPSRAASPMASPPCLINEGQDGQLDLQIVTASAGERPSAVNGRCSTRSAEPVRPRARYRAVPFAPDSIGRPGNACPTFSPDGRTAIFVASDGGLVESRRDGGRWTAPAPLPFSGTGPGGTSRDGDPFLSPDGSRLFFSSARETSAHSADGGTARPTSDIWVVERRTDGWGTPQQLGLPVDGGGEPFPSVATDGTLYFGSARAGGRGGTDLYRARPSGAGYAKPENLGVAINSPATELDGYVSPDQDLLVFASDRPGGFGGLDLYVSHRVVGGWSPARNLGRAVNSADDEFCPHLTPDGRLLLFSTPRGVFQIDAAVLDDATP